MSGRSFGSSYDRVAPRVEAFVRGLADGGVGATLKHFPGLGTGGETTDLTLGEALVNPGAPDTFTAGIEAGAAAVMMSSATDRTGPFKSTMPAFVTRAPYRWLRSQGFDGVTITDDLSTEAVSSDTRLPRPAVQAVAAGADMVLFVDTTGSDAGAAVADLARGARSGTVPRSRLVEAWRHIDRVRAGQRTVARDSTC